MHQDSDRRLSHGSAIILFTFAVSAFSAGCLDNDVTDARCGPDAPDNTIDDDCNRQPHGPQVDPGVCEPSVTTAQSAAGWREAFGVMTATSGGNCSAANCHGVLEKAQLGIWLPAEDQTTFYNTLVTTTGTRGDKYVDPDNPLDSWIHCNVAGRPGGGNAMPKPGGMQLTADAQVIEDWVLNGAPGP